MNACGGRDRVVSLNYVGTYVGAISRAGTHFSGYGVYQDLAA